MSAPFSQDPFNNPVNPTTNPFTKQGTRTQKLKSA